MACRRGAFMEAREEAERQRGERVMRTATRSESDQQAGQCAEPAVRPIAAEPARETEHAGHEEAEARGDRHSVHPWIPHHNGAILSHAQGHRRGGFENGRRTHASGLEKYIEQQKREDISGGDENKRGEVLGQSVSS